MYLFHPIIIRGILFQTGQYDTHCYFLYGEGQKTGETRSISLCDFQNVGRRSEIELIFYPRLALNVAM